MKKTLIFTLAFLPASTLSVTALSTTAEAVTWGEITFLPREAFWDEELQDYLLGDSYELAIRNPDTFGLEKILTFSCNLDEFGDDPSVVIYDVNIVFEGTGAAVLPVSAAPEDWFLGGGDLLSVRFVTPSRDFSEDWEWSRYEEDYVGGMPSAFTTSAVSYWDVRNMNWITVETLGQNFTLDLTAVRGYLQAFERKCAEF